MCVVAEDKDDCENEKVSPPSREVSCEYFDENQLETVLRKYQDMFSNSPRMTDHIKILCDWILPGVYKELRQDYFLPYTCHILQSGHEGAVDNGH